jgi:hypothetical protein
MAWLAQSRTRWRGVRRREPNRRDAVSAWRATGLACDRERADPSSWSQRVAWRHPEALLEAAAGAAGLS